MKENRAVNHKVSLFVKAEKKKKKKKKRKTKKKNKQTNKKKKKTSSRVTLALYSRESIVEIESKLLISTEADSGQRLWSLDVWIQARTQTFESGG